MGRSVVITAFVALAARSTSGTKRIPSRKSIPTSRVPATSASPRTRSAGQPRARSISVPSTISQLTPLTYRNPNQLGEGGVLVVGASATGTQLADEINRSGRPVTLAVGEHVRMPRVYRGRDIQWWMDAAGILNERYDEIDDINRARNVPPPQLAGSPERTTLDLNALTKIGVKLIGRFAGVNDGKAQFSGSLRNNCALADLKMNRLLNTIDEWAVENGLDQSADPDTGFPESVV